MKARGGATASLFTSFFIPLALRWDGRILVPTPFLHGLVGFCVEGTAALPRAIVRSLPPGSSDSASLPEALSPRCHARNGTESFCIDPGVRRYALFELCSPRLRLGGI